MNAPMLKTASHIDETITLDDKYTAKRVFMNGTQALVRLPLLQKERDVAAGLNTAGFISGYRGSPLGNVDLNLWKASNHLKEHDIVFQPGLNEELAATSVWGSQQLNLFPQATREGVFAMWYGKGPGLDRSMDVFKHANNAGTSKHGGVLLIAGDDHAAKSSTVAYQSEHDLQAAGIPVLYPANIQEYIDFGLHGWAMSRFSGLWISLKCVTDVVESSASVVVDPDRITTLIPENFTLPDDGLNIRWPDTPAAQEERMNNYKWYAALAYVRANKLDKIVIDSPCAKFGIMSAGKAYLDTRQALNDLGLDEKTCSDIGIRLYKVGCVWPLEAQGAREFAEGLDEILVVEEKRQIMEYALKEELYNWRDDVRPEVYGKYDARDNGGGEWSVPRGAWLLPPNLDLSPAIIAKAIAKRLEKHDLPSEIRERIRSRIALITRKENQFISVVAERKPWFCSGCPHNTSTRVPEGSRAVAGIGCHYMTIWMDRQTQTFSQMGGEGAAWIGQKSFTNEKHIFSNLGDGTYFHSGILAIRASIAAKSNITYKILFNDAVAMTGGQPIDGQLTVAKLHDQLIAEGVSKLVVVSDEPDTIRQLGLATSTGIYHRSKLDEVQKMLRDTLGTTALIYVQTCATEKRRRRKRGKYSDPAIRTYINEDVCEGCGDCGQQSNCLSIEPIHTPMGTKRKINQSSCNKDFSCIQGFCPSFISAKGAQLRKPQAQRYDLEKRDIPFPALATIERSYNILVPGVGGTGVVTIGALLGMAAHLENKGVNILDITGLAQKGGAVVSHIQIGKHPSDLYSTRIGTGEADLIIACDAIVATSKEITSKILASKTYAAVNSAKTPTADLIHNPKWSFPSSITQNDLGTLLGQENCDFLDASFYAFTLLGDAIYANPLLLGYVWQKGKIPLSLDALHRAIELNGVAVEKNIEAFYWGRYLAHFGTHVLPHSTNNNAHQHEEKEDTDALLQRLQRHLTAYQNKRWANNFLNAVKPIRDLEQALFNDTTLTHAVAKNLAKLMSYKDEYEVARLYTRPEYIEKLRHTFEGEPGKDYALHVHIAPPIFAPKNGLLQKKEYGSWAFTLFNVLRHLKGLRGTPLDIFGYSQERKTERQLITEYQKILKLIETSLTPKNLDIALELANLPDDIRGYGHIKQKNIKKTTLKKENLLKKFLN